MAGAVWRLLPLSAGAPAWNMAVDQALLELSLQATLRLYTWDPTAISLGVLQRTGDLPPDWLGPGAVPLVRRITGGGAVRHGAGDLTISLVIPAAVSAIPSSLDGSYASVNQALRLALQLVGIEVDANLPDRAPSRRGPVDCFALATSVDLTAGGVKVAGAAQRRTRGRLLEHLSVRHDPVALAPHVLEAFQRTFALDLHPGELTREEEHRACELERTRYVDDRWTFRR